MLLLVVGTVLSIAFAIIGGVGRAVFGHDDASPTAMIVVPPSSPADRGCDGHRDGRCATDRERPP